MSDAAAQITAIRLAFHHVTERGGGPTLREADVIRQYGPANSRRENARALDNDKRWWQISDASFDKSINPFPHLDDKAFVYYMPAILTWCLKNHDRAIKHKLLASLLDALVMPTRWDLVDAQKKRFAAFNREQATVIAACLKFWAGLDNAGLSKAQDALDSYWKQFA
ncbi:DUF6714 family protein [Leeia oryzae]|uniref:DUF6714 family protein n=1 Tax=Leeia oryzae TaxID=356662 RepID=UPI0003726A59|nr:DUF6714 family protein [Leeia oryzae]